MIILASPALLMLAMIAAPARTIHVDVSNPDCPGSGSPSDPFCRIQDGIDAGRDGDTVLVAPGVYLESLDLGDKSLTLRSSAGAEQTIIDGRWQSTALRISGPSAPTIEGFTIRRGTPGILCEDASPLLRQNIIRECDGFFAAALVLKGSGSPRIEDNEILENRALRAHVILSGGEGHPTFTRNWIHGNEPGAQSAVLALLGETDASIEENRFTDHQAGYFGATVILVHDQARASISRNLLGDRTIATPGTGIVIEGGSSATVQENEIRRFVPGPTSSGRGIRASTFGEVSLVGNEIVANEAEDDGGGAWIQGPDTVVRGNLFADNRAGRGGGGLFIKGQGCDVRGNRFERNQARERGGGLYSFGNGLQIVGNRFRRNAVKAGDGGGLFLAPQSAARVIGNEIVQNRASRRGGGIFAFHEIVLLDTTIADNVSGAGGGLYLELPAGASTILDTIVWGNRPDSIAGPGSAAVTVEHSDVEGGFSGPGNLAADPVFRDPVRLDYRLSCKSPCVDAGSEPSRFPRPRFDLGGRDLSPIGRRDMGADEVGLHLELTGPARPGGPPVGFVLTHSDPGRPLFGIVFLSLGDGSDGGIQVPGSDGRRLGLDLDPLFGLWTRLPPSTRLVPLSGCQGAMTSPVRIPARAPAGLEIFHAGVSFDLDGEFLSVSETGSFRLQ